MSQEIQYPLGLASLAGPDQHTLPILRNALQMAVLDIQESQILSGNTKGFDLGFDVFNDFVFLGLNKSLCFVLQFIDLLLDLL